MTQPDTSVTLRDALLAAHEAVQAAQRACDAARLERNRVVTLALVQGATLRQIGGLLGVTGQAVHQWVGTPDRQGVLDQPLEAR